MRIVLCALKWAEFPWDAGGQWRLSDAVEMGGNRQNGQKLCNPRISFPRELNLCAPCPDQRSQVLECDGSQALEWFYKGFRLDSACGPEGAVD